MRNFRPLAFVVLVVVGLTWAFFRPSVERMQRPVVGDVTVNGRPIANTLITERGRVYVSVPDLARAIDGGQNKRLRVKGASLLAIEDGACKTCDLIVRRAVQISDNVRIFPNGPYIPLDDLARALEARLDTTTHTTFNLYVGSCSWCILAPLEKSR